MAAARRRRRPMVVGAAVIVLVAVGSGVGVSLASGGGSTVAARPPTTTSPPATTPPTTTGTTAVTAADVAAARACQAFSTYLADAGNGVVPKAVGQALVADAESLLSGAAKDEAAKLPLPKWAELGADLLSAAQDVVKHDSTSLQTDGTAAARQCQTVPAAAARAGGYVRTPA